jgi:hypothetical protein
MGFWQRIKGGIQVVVGGVSQGREIVKGVTANSGQTRPKQGEDWLSAYNTMPWLRANVAKIAQGVSSLEWGITRTMDANGFTVKMPNVQKGNLAYRRKALAALTEDGQAEPVFDHPFLTLWKNPCPALPGGAARKLAQVYYEIVGEVFFVVDRGPRDGWIKGQQGRPLPTALWPVPPQWVKRVPTPDNPTFEIRHLGLQMNNVPMSEVLWLKDPDPVNPYSRGVGLFYSLNDELDADENAAKMIGYSFYNRNRPDVLVSVPSASDTELQAFRNEWAANLQGVANVLKSHFVNVEADVQQIGFDFREMQVMELRKSLRDSIRQVPGMPPEMLGIQDQSNRSTIEAAEFIFNKHLIEPRAEVWREFLETQVLFEYDDRAVLDYVSPVEEDKAYALQVVSASPEVFRVNEKRKMAGQPALTEEEGGSFFFVNGAFVPSLVTPAAPVPGAPGAAGGLSQPGFEGGINVPGAPTMHLSVPSAPGSAESGVPAGPAPIGLTVPGLPSPGPPKGVGPSPAAMLTKALAGRRKLPEVTLPPDVAKSIGRWLASGDLIPKGEASGHEFRGNQWTDGGGGERGGKTPLARDRDAASSAIRAGRLSEPEVADPREYIVDLVGKLREDGGFSVSTRTGEHVKEGWMVSPYKAREGKIEGRAKFADIEAYAGKNADLLSRPDHYLGGWYNPEDNHTYLDVSVRKDTAEEARALAKEHDQLEYGHITPNGFTSHKTNEKAAGQRKGLDPNQGGHVEKGDLEGHEFRGNQWTGGQGGGDDPGNDPLVLAIKNETTTEGGDYDPITTQDSDGDGVTDAARVGVPAFEVPPPPTVGRLPNLTPDERAVETEFADAFEQDPDGAAGKYLAMVKGDPPPTFETDAAKMLHAGWKGEGADQEKRAEFRSTMNVALHQTANAIAKRAFVQHLDSMSDEEKAKGILVTVGGCGAGKGYALETLAGEGYTDFNKKLYGAVWDSAGDQNATENPWILKEAEARGIKVTYAYVSADPEVSWADEGDPKTGRPARGVVARAMKPKDGRMVDSKVFADSYVIGAKNHAAFAERNKGRARFVYVKNGQPIESLDGVPSSDTGRDKGKLHDFAVRTIEQRAKGLPSRVKRGALIGERVWREGRRKNKR